MTDTKVVNVRVKYLRPKYNNLKEWTNDPANVYIGRRGIVFIDGERYPKEDNIWYNPFKTGTREEVVAQFESYMRAKLDKSEVLVTRLLQLKGKNLGCWCAPELCHGEVLVRLIDEYAAKNKFIAWYLEKQAHVDGYLRAGDVVIAHEEDGTITGHIFDSSTAALMYAEAEKWPEDSYLLINWYLDKYLS